MMSYNFTDLVLLIGTNPLPNYVVSTFFLQNNNNLSHIWLVYSDSIGNQDTTKHLAENIKCRIEVLLRDCPRKQNLLFSYIPLINASSSQQIARDMDEHFIFKIIKEHSRTFHLNYTGGTKAMAVHVYRSLEKYLNKDQKNNRCTFSYLNAREHLILDDDAGCVGNDLRKQIKVSLEDLKVLHGYKRIIKEDKVTYESVIEKFSELIKENKLELFFDWKNGKNEKKVKNGNNEKKGMGDYIKLYLNAKKEDYSDFQKKRIALNTEIEMMENTDKEIMNLLRSFRTDDFLLDDHGQLWNPTLEELLGQRERRIQKPTEKFLNGKWLERYVETVINKNYKDDLKSCSSTMESNMRIYNENDKDFEIDILIIYGYQICCISLTTTVKEKECKGKGFETLTRSRQIGGEEAKSILITCLDEESKHRVTSDLHTVTGSNEGSIKVLGINDLEEEKLWVEISDYIWGRD